MAHADTPAALSNLNYVNSNHTGILEWVNTFVNKTGVSGQVRRLWISLGFEGLAKEVKSDFVMRRKYFWSTE